MRLDESPFKNYQKDDYRLLLEDYNSKVLKSLFPKTARSVKIWDESLRDGEQSPGASMSVEQKLEFAKLLAQAGVDVIEAGFPIASEGDFQAVRAIAEEVQRTRRRTNALEHILIPDLTEARKYITDHLEEIARSDISRLMKVKQMLLERAAVET